MSVPILHRSDLPLAQHRPFEPARRYWRGNAPEYDVVALSVDDPRMLVGEAKWSAKEGASGSEAAAHVRTSAENARGGE